jgi:radical SAM protein with 4Fe4S-binding SPASM domain
MIVPIKALIRSMRVIHLKITPKRVVNIIKIYSSMFISRLTGKQVVWGYPLFLMVEPTNICNLKCPMCPSGNGDMSRSLGKLDLENYKRLLDNVGDYILQVQLWNQGEPLINKNFHEFVRYAREKGIMTQTSTNGHYFRDDDAAGELVTSGLDILIFSLDGTNQETYEKYRVGGKYEVVLDGLERISAARDRLGSATPLIELQFIVFKHNQQEIDEIKQIARRLKIDRLSFKTAQVYSDDQAAEFLPDSDDFKRYNYDGDSLQMKGQMVNWCKRLWLNSTVNWDGSVSPCCFDKDADHAFANIFESGTGFRQVWRNVKYMAFRRRVMENRASIEMCRNCTEGLKVPYTQIIELDDLK